MAVEVVFLTVVMRTTSMARLDAQAQATVQDLFHWQRDWFRHDPHLLATSFMAPADVRAFGTALECRTPLRRGQDWAVVDALVGLLEPTPWLSFRGGPGEATGVWLEGTQPGELSRVRSLLPARFDDLRTTGKVVQAFERDSTQDEDKPHRTKDRLLPSWGGTSLWLLEVVPCHTPTDDLQDGRLVTFEARELDFMTYAQNPDGTPNVPGGRP